jgi:hypothetical protein
MRKYWDEQDPAMLFGGSKSELKTKLLEKIESLHKLEKVWQEAYFNLMEKEEIIRKEEKELKEALTEFINVYKKRSGKTSKR